MKKHPPGAPRPRRIEVDSLYRERLEFILKARPGLFTDEGVRRLLGVSLETFKRDRRLLAGDEGGETR